MEPTKEEPPLIPAVELERIEREALEAYPDDTALSWSTGSARDRNKPSRDVWIAGAKAEYLRTASRVEKLETERQRLDKRLYIAALGNTQYREKIAALEKQVQDFKTKLQLAHKEVHAEMMRYNRLDETQGFMAVRQGRLNAIEWMLKTLDGQWTVNWNVSNNEIKNQNDEGVRVP